MKSNTYKNSREEQQIKTNIWYSFTDYLETAYFPGASELTDKQNIFFEYKAFNQCFAKELRLLFSIKKTFHIFRI